ncbi:MAG: hypothetical protein ACHQK8_09770, partial [Bacteroidia bacterium]
MNKSEFITLVEHPGNLGKSHIPALKNIAADFPYFQANQFLLAKALFNENHYEFEKQLRSTALLVTDREILYHFLHGIETPEKTETFPQPDEVTEVIEALNIEVVEETKEETEIVSMPGEGQQKEVPETEIPVPVEMPGSPEVAPGEAEEDEEETEEEREDEESDEERHKRELHSFDEWIQLFGNNQIKTSERVVEINSPETVSKEEYITGEKEEKPRSNIPDFESILDKFIRENPSI